MSNSRGGSGTSRRRTSSAYRNTWIRNGRGFLRGADLLDYKHAIDFHGHEGPFLALGYKIGEYAREKLKPSGIMDLRALIFLKKIEKPYTCVLDGIQCSTTCTLGKGNIEVREGDGWRVEIEGKNGKVIFVIKEETIEYFLSRDDLERTAEEVRENPLERWVFLQDFSN
ncbi:hypothetical protein DRQ16_00690 [bacterium]|nr:MAG: hypothetical protein DRQ16_00690 [bacterium]